VQQKSKIYDLCSEPTVANLAAPVSNIIMHKDQEITSAACVHLLFFFCVEGMRA
jgi:hypothetical protein